MIWQPKKTTQFFREILTSDYKVKDIKIDRSEEMYLVTCQTEEEERVFRFPTELIELIDKQIKNEPHKFHNYE